MKKVVKISILLFGVFLLTGCFGTKKLTCTNKKEDSYGTIVAKITYTYKDDEITKVKYSVLSTIKDKDTFNLLKKNYEKENKNLNKIDGVTAKFKTAGTKLKLNVDVNMKKAEDNALSKADIDKGNYETVKKKLEKQGFTCK